MIIAFADFKRSVFGKFMHGIFLRKIRKSALGLLIFFCFKLGPAERIRGLRRVKRLRKLLDELPVMFFGVFIIGALEVCFAEPEKNRVFKIGGTQKCLENVKGIQVLAFKKIALPKKKVGFCSSAGLRIFFQKFVDVTDGDIVKTVVKGFLRNDVEFLFAVGLGYDRRKN